MLSTTCITDTTVEMNASNERTVQILTGSNLANAVMTNPMVSSIISKLRVGDRRDVPREARGRVRAESATSATKSSR